MSQAAVDLKSKNASDLESWFLSALETDPLPLEALLEGLQQGHRMVDADALQTWSGLLIDALAARRDRAGMVRYLQVRVAFEPDTAALRQACFREAQAVFKDRLGGTLLKSAGFEGEAPATECVRRLDLLLRLKPGAMCLDGTWGFGIVKECDDFYGRIIVDFVRKPGHPMAFAYAAESLQLLRPDHLLARRHADPAGLRALAATDPAELVRVALRSFGPLDAARLHDILVDGILTEAEWKGFWDAARKALKADAMVHVPAKRSEPIRILERAKDYGAEWFAALAAERDLKQIMLQARELESRTDIAALPAEQRKILVDRLRFVAHAAEGRHHDELAVCWMTAERMGIGAETFDAGRMRELLGAPAALTGAVGGLTSRELPVFLPLLAGDAPAAVAEKLVAHIERLPLDVLDETIRFTVASGRETELAAKARGLLLSGGMDVIWLTWLCQNLDTAGRWALGSWADFVGQALHALSEDCMYARLRAQNELWKLFRDKGWLERALGPLTPGERETFLGRINRARGMDEGEKRSLLARLIRMYPELEAVVSRAAAGEGAGKKLLTSWRSYRERQEQLRKLVQETIPENSREIATARGYGDLRENFEYQTAKDRQRLLMQRQAEMEQELKEVQGTDFAGMPADRAGMGTCVWVTGPDGRELRFCILGEWDRDEGLGIIACGSAVARALDGRAAGDTAVLPAATFGSHAPGETAPCTVARIGGLSDDIRSWIAARAY